MEEPETVPKWLFHTVVGVVSMGFAALGMVLLIGVELALGVRLPGGTMGGFVLPNMIVSYLAVDRLFKHFGLSRSGQTVEVRGRAAPEPEGYVEPGEVTEVHLSAGTKWGALVGCLVVAAFMACSPLYFPEAGQWIWRWMCLGMCGVMSIGFVETWFDWNTPWARADADGITAVPMKPIPWRRFVPWTDIAICEISTIHNPFGEPVLIRPTLKRKDGKTLMVVNLSQVPLEDQQRLVRAIQANLPKIQLDPWDF